MERYISNENDFILDLQNFRVSDSPLLVKTCVRSVAHKLISKFTKVHLWDKRVYSLSEVNDLDIKHERGVRRDNTSSAAGAVGVVGWACQPSPLAFLELHNAFVPSSDDLADAYLELKGLSAVNAWVKLGAIEECASVVDFNSCTLRNGGSSSLVKLLNNKSWHTLLVL